MKNLILLLALALSPLTSWAAARQVPAGIVDFTQVISTPTVSTSTHSASYFKTDGFPYYRSFGGSEVGLCYSSSVFTNHSLLLGANTRAPGFLLASSESVLLGHNSSSDPTFGLIANVHVSASAALDPTKINFPAAVASLLDDTSISQMRSTLGITVTSSAISASDIDWSTLAASGGIYTKTLGANTTFTFSSKAVGQTIVVRLTNTASNYTVTWPTVKWPAGSTPTQTVGAKADVYTFIYDGTDVYGSAVQNF